MRNEVEDEDADTDQALDHDERLRRVDAELARDQRGADLEERERKADGDCEREDDLAPRELDVLFFVVRGSRIVR